MIFHFIFQPATQHEHSHVSQYLPRTHSRHFSACLQLLNTEQAARRFTLQAADSQTRHNFSSDRFPASHFISNNNIYFNKYINKLVWLILVYFSISCLLLYFSFPCFRGVRKYFILYLVRNNFALSCLQVLFLCWSQLYFKFIVLILQ